MGFGLLLVAFVPLYFAVATYTRQALRQIRSSEAAALGRAVAAHLLDGSREHSPNELQTLADEELRSAKLVAAGVYDPAGRPLAETGARTALGTDATELSGAREIEHAGMRALRVRVAAATGSATVVIRIDDHASQAAPLLRLVGLYTGLVALALLVLSYFTLTRLIVRPLDQLTRAAERVASGARRWIAPVTTVPELAQLGQSLGTMTEALISEEAALRKKVDEFEAATARLKEAQHRLVASERLASVGRLAAGLAHEIGNPLSALMGMQDLLLDGGLNEAEQRDFVERMRRETERIHRILRDLLQFARPSARSSTDPVEPGDVAAAITDTLTLLAPQKALKEIELRLDLEQDLPLIPLGREQLVQILLNLVLNAADVVSAGGQISVRARVVGGAVELSVEDDGPGVSPEIRDRLFEPFATTKEVGHGTGLGLAVCRGLVEASGGSIALDDSYGPGARFVMSFPSIDRESIA
jgi:signal transduction histidine kinase